MKKELVNLIKNLKKAQKDYFNIIKTDVDYIINNKIVDKNMIEHLLDGLLDVCNDEESIKYYYKLCDYYEKIDKENSTFYRKVLKKFL